MSRKGTTDTMPTWVALLRGINVGGNSKVPMADLRACFEDAGCEQVRTYIQSGNVVFAAPAALATSIPDRIAACVQERLGVTTWLVLRSADELQRIVAGNPFAALDAPPTAVAVAFLREALPEHALVHADDRNVPDKVVRAGKEVYLYLPNGMSGAKLDPKFFTKDLATATTRNWRTVTKLMEMLTT